MIQGLRWSNVFWFFFFTILFIGLATGKGPHNLNLNVLTWIYNSGVEGVDRLEQQSTEWANDLEERTIEAHGADSFEARFQLCPKDTKRVNKSALMTYAQYRGYKALAFRSRSHLIQQIGEPYCTNGSSDYWLVDTHGYFTASYNPVRLTYREMTTAE